MSKDDIQNLGNLLRQNREEKNFSLKEVENATSIRINYLKSIEDGDISKLISPVYAQGFIKQYAAFLGLEGDSLIKQYHSCFGKMEKQEFDYGIGTLEKRGNPGTTSGWLPNFIYLVAAAGILALAWYFAMYLGVF